MTLSKQQLEAFENHGFIVIKDFLPQPLLDSVRSWVDSLVDSLVEDLFAHGKIKNKYQDEDFNTRLAKIEVEFPGAAVLIHTQGVMGNALGDLWSCPELLDLLQQILGDEIVGHPVWNLRSKTPNNPLTTVPWHQDAAYVSEAAEGTQQIAAWIPLVSTGIRNGTLELIKARKKFRNTLRHRLERESGEKRSWYLALDERNFTDCEKVIVPLDPGSLILFDQLVPHRCGENFSNHVRWTVDLRWQRAGEPHGLEGIKDCIPMRVGGADVFSRHFSDGRKRRELKIKKGVSKLSSKRRG